MFDEEKKKFSVSADLLEEVVNRPLEVSGAIPQWLSGALVRNGPINVKIDGKTNSHWFDGLAMLHLFAFHEGAVSYSNKFLRTEAYDAVFNHGSLGYLGFAVDPCRSIFKSIFTYFAGHADDPLHNANINVGKLADRYVAYTEVPLPVQFDIQTLDTLGVFDYRDHLPKDKCWQSAHPHVDFTRMETVGYLIKFGPKSSYTFYKVKDGSASREIIAEVNVDKPAYMHSFAITANYVILTEFPLVVNPISLMFLCKPFIKNFRWLPERKTRIGVICRKTGKVISRSSTRPFFAFHHVNAYEDEDFVHLDIVTYKDASIVTGDTLYLGRGKISMDDYPLGVERFSVSLSSGEVSSRMLFSGACEFPRINPVYDGRMYHFVYTVGFIKQLEDKNKFLDTCALHKIDVANGTLLTWEEEGCSPGEPVFVAAPDAKSEDDGVVLSTVIDHKHQTSFLLVLDGRTFKELARAVAPHLIPMGLHGAYFGSI